MGNVAAGMDALGVVEDTIALFATYRGLGDWMQARMLAIRVVWQALHKLRAEEWLLGTEVFDVRGGSWFYVDVRLGGTGGYLGGQDAFGQDRYTNSDFAVQRRAYDLRLERCSRIGQPSVVEVLVEYANGVVFASAPCSIDGFPTLPKTVPLNL